MAFSDSQLAAARLRATRRGAPPAVCALLLSFFLSLHAATAAAQWGGTQSVSVCDTCRNDGLGFSAIADGAGGVFVTWPDRRYMNGYDTFAQHLTAAGQVATGWDASGLPVSLEDGWGAGVLALDGQGGVLIAWNDTRSESPVSFGTRTDIYVQRLRGDGTFAPDWAMNGVPATRDSADQYDPLIASDGQGGAYVVWPDWRNSAGANANDDLYAQHLTAAGEPAPGWPSNGLAVCAAAGSQWPAGVLPDGSGGVVLVWDDNRRGGGTSSQADIYAQHLLSDGSIAPGWAVDGVLVVMGRTKARVATDGAAGFYVGCSTTDPYGSDLEYYVQRFQFSGVRSPGWPDGGVLVCASLGLTRDGLQVAPDGLGGLLLTWQDERSNSYEVYGARVLPDASLAPGWAVNGTRVSDGTGYQSVPSVASDDAGGAYIAWERASYEDITCLVQHLTSAGSVSANWPPFGVRVEPTTGAVHPSVVENGRGGAIVVWERGAGLYAQRFDRKGTVPVPLSLVSAAARAGAVELEWYAEAGAGFPGTVGRRTERTDWVSLAHASTDGMGHVHYQDRAVSPGERYAYRLGYIDGGVERFTAETWVEVPAFRLALAGFQPNPASGDLTVLFTLPNASPARLQLLDVTGRQWLTRDVGDLGAGSHLVHLGGLVPAGRYWLRLTQSGRSLLASGSVVR